MLADSANDTAGALDALGEASFEYKLDGARIQVHKVDDEVRVYSRTLRDVTRAVPEIVAVTRAMAGAPRLSSTARRSCCVRMDRRSRSRTRCGASRAKARRRSAEGVAADHADVFDALYLDGDPLVDEPLTRRVSRLVDQCASPNLVPRLLTSDPTAAAAFAQRALAAGHEGVMAKALDGAYAAGRRGSAGSR